MEIDKDKSPLTAASELRRHAEERFRAKTVELHPPRTEKAPQRLVHELEVHQIELETQNKELRRAQEELELSRNKYADLYDFAPVGYFTFDARGLIREVNLNGAQLLGIERRLLANKPFISFIADADGRKIFSNHVESVLQSQGMQRCEIRLTGKEGTVIYGLLQSVTVDTVESKDGYILSSIVDGTVGKQLEAELQNAHDKLEAANIELEAFNYRVSHDLRSPLTVISGYCQLIEKLCGNSLDDRCKRYIREMYEGTLCMNRLIDTLLDFSRVTRIEIRHDKVDLSEMAEEVALGLKVSEPERRVKFRIAAGIEAYGDAGLLRVVLYNLIGNAWKYTGNRVGAFIEFGVTEVEGKPACFVRDNGPGFDMACADKLFIPFQRLPGTNVEGNGIGLATVDRIVKRHGGRVWAVSKPGEETTFLFTLEQIPFFLHNTGSGAVFRIEV